jgi:PAS domain S-box-containing protein
MQEWLWVVNAILVVISGIIGGVVVKVWPLLMQSHEQKERLARQKEGQDAKIRGDEREQVYKEFQELLDRSEKDAQRRDAQLQRSDERIEDLFGQVRELTKGHADCLVKNERLIGRISILESTIEAIQTAQNIASLPTRNEAIIVADERGVIREWNQAAVVLFHWKTHEAVGRTVDMIIPPEWLEMHRKGMRSVLHGNKTLNRGPFQLEALTKEGGRIPIELVLSSWSEGEGDRKRMMFSASIRQRPVDAAGNTAEDTLDLGAMTARAVGESGILAAQIKQDDAHAQQHDVPTTPPPTTC